MKTLFLIKLWPRSACNNSEMSHTTFSSSWVKMKKRAFQELSKLNLSLRLRIKMISKSTFRANKSQTSLSTAKTLWKHSKCSLKATKSNLRHRCLIKINTTRSAFTLRTLTWLMAQAFISIRIQRTIRSTFFHIWSHFSATDFSLVSISLRSELLSN